MFVLLLTFDIYLRFIKLAHSKLTIFETDILEVEAVNPSWCVHTWTIKVVWTTQILKKISFFKK